MKQRLLKPVLMTVLSVCLTVTLFSTFSSTRTVHAHAQHALCGSSASVSPGWSWGPGSHLYATANDCGQLDLTYQDDGNFVLYHNGQPIWDTGTSLNWVQRLYGGYDAAYTSFQLDGNLVVYQTLNHPEQGYIHTFSVWGSTTENQGATTLALQSDGNLVIYRDTTPLWASHTNKY